ncbi:unnamed protein product [Calicophoron daubneyi]|uniref:Innexin n=1 Tax=Calicophoron daubneyi TaxID=300641 RepID=A0AAV2TNT1_CALDB
MPPFLLGTTSSEDGPINGSALSEFSLNLWLGHYIGLYTGVGTVVLYARSRVKLNYGESERPVSNSLLTIGLPHEEAGEIVPFTASPIIIAVNHVGYKWPLPILAVYSGVGINMVALEFFSQLDKLRFADSVGLDDFADRCSYMLSFILLVMCFTIVTLKSYVFEPLSCYIPTTFSGSNLGSYINAFCWVNGTTPISADTDRLDDESYWASLEGKKLNYYQWVSLVLALQAILCYLPRLVWETITFNRVGTNLGFLVESAQAASKETGKERDSRVQFVANVMDTLLFARRDLRKPEQLLQQQRETSALSSCIQALRDLLPRKRLGTALVTYYLIVKFLYLFNAVGQILIMQRFLGAEGKYKLFGLSILGDLIMGRHWNETSVFPRVGFCRVPIKLTSTPIPMVTVQCTLPVNMLNEKVYIFLWFWFVFVSTLEAASILSWVFRLAARQSRLRLLVRYLKIADAYDEGMEPLIARFEMTFLRPDGSFLLQMMRLNAGSLITQEILQAMLKRYTQQEEYALAVQKRRKEKQQQQQKTYNKSGDLACEKSGLLTPEIENCNIVKRSEPV